MKELIAAIILLASSSAADAEIIVEIHRTNAENISDVVVRQFHDMDEVSMWFEEKLESDSCDPRAHKIILYPKGK